jgi:fatty-acyl-CoA synthase
VSSEIEWLEHRARLTPNRTAVIDGETGEHWNYDEMNQRACRLAKHLRTLGVSKGDRIALLSPNHISYFDLIFACGKLGAIFVPLNWRLSISELAYMIGDCAPKILAYHDQMKTLTEGLEVAHRLEVDGQVYHQVTDSGELLLSSVSLDWLDPLAIIYTGGTTGKPKGVVLTHQSIVWNSINTILSWNLTSEDITPTYLPMFHTGGLNALSIPILHMGGTVVIARDFHPEKAIQLINRERCTIALMVPTMYHMMIQSESFYETDFPTMHTFLSGGAPCPHAIYDVFEKKNLVFKEGYGLTEAGPNNFYMNPQEVRGRRGSVGKPMMYNQIKMMVTEEAEAAPGEVGEIWIRGNHLFDHYWNNSDATSEALVDGWLRTGDLGKQDEDGYVYIVGRKKEMIITGGENVYPLEVEHSISEHDAVDAVAVVGLPDLKWGEIVTAIVVLRKGATLTAEQLKEHCSAKLGKYKVPKKIVFADELPKTPVGKIDKKEIIRKYA